MYARYLGAKVHESGADILSRGNKMECQWKDVANSILLRFESHG